jgi:hypothetical protein
MINAKEAHREKTLVALSLYAQVTLQPGIFLKGAIYVN